MVGTIEQLCTPFVIFSIVFKTVKKERCFIFRGGVYLLPLTILFCRLVHQAVSST